MKINVYNEYDPLKTVIIGDASRLFFPDTHAIENEANMPLWKKLMTNTVYRLLRGKEVPPIITKHYQEELAQFEALLTANGVKVLKLDPIVPTAAEDYGSGQMYARDSAMAIGNLFVEGHLQIGMRKKERRGYQTIVKAIKASNPVATMSQEEPAYLEGGDVLVDYPNIFVGIGKYASNMSGINWLRKQLDDSWKIIPIYLQDDAILHLDCCMTIIGPKTAIICRDVLGDLPEELKDYTFIDIDKKTRQELGGNVLVLGHQKIIVQARHKKLQADLRAQGFTVLPMDFTWHALLDGAFRCASCPLERETQPQNSPSALPKTAANTQ